MQAMWVQSLGQKDPLEKETATHSSILAWEILWIQTDQGDVVAGPLHFSFPVLEILCLKIPAWVTSSLLSGLCSNAM